MDALSRMKSPGPDGHRFPDPSVQTRIHDRLTMVMELSGTPKQEQSPLRYPRRHGMILTEANNGPQPNLDTVLRITSRAPTATTVESTRVGSSTATLKSTTTPRPLWLRPASTKAAPSQQSPRRLW